MYGRRIWAMLHPFCNPTVLELSSYCVITCICVQFEKGNPYEGGGGGMILVQSLNVIIVWSFKKFKSKGFMVYSNALICLLFRKKKFTKFFLGNYLSEICRFSCGPSKHISMDQLTIALCISN